jgi:hypothetical protein
VILPPIGWGGALAIVLCMAFWWLAKASYYNWWPFRDD